MRKGRESFGQMGQEGAAGEGKRLREEGSFCSVGEGEEEREREGKE